MGRAPRSSLPHHAATHRAPWAAAAAARASRATRVSLRAMVGGRGTGMRGGQGRAGWWAVGECVPGRAGGARRVAPRGGRRKAVRRWRPVCFGHYSLSPEAGPPRRRGPAWEAGPGGGHATPPTPPTPGCPPQPPVAAMQSLAYRAKKKAGQTGRPGKDDPASRTESGLGTVLGAFWGCRVGRGRGRGRGAVGVGTRWLWSGSRPASFRLLPHLPPSPTHKAARQPPRHQRSPTRRPRCACLTWTPATGPAPVPPGWRGKIGVCREGWRVAPAH